jgi:hypothetical protein
MRWHVGCCPFGLIAKTDIPIKKRAGTAHFRNRFIAVTVSAEHFEY